MSKANELINLLLDKYEERLSSLSNRRIMIKKREIDSFDTKLEDRKEFIAAVKELKELNIIDYEALKGYEKENLFEAIWLVLTDDSLLKAYNKAKRIPLLEKINTLITLLTSYHFEKEELSS